MKKYNYKEVMKNDVLEAIKEHMEYENVSVEDLDIDTLKDYLWTDDSVTGNGSGSYTMNSALSKEYVLDNEDLQVEMIKEFAQFGLDIQDIAKHLHDYEYWDVSIRCYLLGEVLEDVLKELQQ